MFGPFQHEISRLHQFERQTQAYKAQMLDSLEIVVDFWPKQPSTPTQTCRYFKCLRNPADARDPRLLLFCGEFLINMKGVERAKAGVFQ
jgi:hypothetical protein